LADEDEEEEGLEGQGLEDESLPKSEKANGNILQFGNSRISPTDKLYEESAHPNPPPAAVDQANSDHLISIVVNDDRYSSSAKKDE
jgi:hypothetical protein